jgi:type VI secretion system protein ImpG
LEFWISEEMLFLQEVLFMPNEQKCITPSHHSNTSPFYSGLSMIDKYYEEELRYLYESGKEFAKTHPDRARFLNIDAVGDRDPYVERLFEGFAFLAGRIREKLDDSFPELTEGLIDLMWPQFLQEVPSLTIVQFRPRPGLLNDTRTLARGCEVLSGPVGAESVPCRFITAQDVRLHPLTLRTVDKSVDTRGNAQLSLRFELDSKVSWEDVSLAPLRLYLHAERPTALMLREYMTSRVTKAQLNINDGQMQLECDPSRVCTPVGYAPDEALLPEDHRCFWASAMLLEYFVYPEKFFFVDLWGCEHVPPCDPSPHSLVYTLTFNADFPPDEKFSVESFRLYCSPAANLFRSDIEPVNHTGAKSEYRLIADAGHHQSVGVHSVLSVVGIDRITGQRFDYEPLNTFKNIGAKNGRTYSIRRNRSPGGARQVMLCIGGEGLDELELREQNLNIEAWCTNGVLPREEISEKGINRGGRDFPDNVMVTNITRPTLPCYPPDRDDYLWVFLSHQGSNYLSLADADNLKSFLRLYNWSAEEGNMQRIESITSATAQSAQKSVAGSVVRGIRFEISVTSSHFENDAEIRLFGEVLKEFLSQYVSINSYIDLVLVSRPSGRAVTFSSAPGKQWLI